MKINVSAHHVNTNRKQGFAVVPKALFTMSVSACIAITLASCTKENTNETAQAPSNDTTAPTAPFRIAAAANLSDVLPQIIEGYKADNNLPNQDIEVTRPLASYMRRLNRVRLMIFSYPPIKNFRKNG